MLDSLRITYSSTQRHPDGRASERIGREDFAPDWVGTARARRRGRLVCRDPSPAREHPVPKRIECANGVLFCALSVPACRLSGRRWLQSKGLFVDASITFARCSRGVSSSSSPARRSPQIRDAGTAPRGRTRARGDVGISVKYGITSALTLDATVILISVRWRATVRGEVNPAVSDLLQREAPSSWRGSAS